MQNYESTKQRIVTARRLAKEEFGDAGDNLTVIAAILQSLAVDELSSAIQNQMAISTDALCQAAAVAAGD